MRIGRTGADDVAADGACAVEDEDGRGGGWWRWHVGAVGSVDGVVVLCVGRQSVVGGVVGGVVGVGCDCEWRDGVAFLLAW